MGEAQTPNWQKVILFGRQSIWQSIWCYCQVTTHEHHAQAEEYVKTVVSVRETALRRKHGTGYLLIMFATHALSLAEPAKTTSCRVD